jgi:hypothetical protein
MSLSWSTRCSFSIDDITAPEGVSGDTWIDGGAQRMYPLFLINAYAKELVRPWKLLTLSIAVGYYIWGAYYYRCPTWDVPVSLIMSVLTYVCAPWTVKSVLYLLQARPKHWQRSLIFCILVTYACASGSYELYNWWHLGYYPPPTYWVNLYYSTLMFIGAGLFWKFDGTFSQLLQTLWADVQTSAARFKVKK